MVTLHRSPPPLSLVIPPRPAQAASRPAYRGLRRQGPLPASLKVVVAVVGLAVGSRPNTSGPLWIIPLVLAPVALGWLVASVREASADIDRALAELIPVDSAAPDPGDDAA